MKKIELNINSLKTEKAKRLDELNSLVYGLDCTVDNPLFVEQMQIAKELAGELQKDNPKFIFALKHWDANEVDFICKLATGTSLDGEFGMDDDEPRALNIDATGYFEHDDYCKLFEGVILP
jgi:hypothetical protein